MAMMKIKNENGEWVPVAPTNFMHQFKLESIEPVSDNKVLDLSPYVQKDADFMLFMRPRNFYGKTQVYVHSDGKLRRYSDFEGMGSDVDELDDIFQDTGLAFEYDEETRQARREDGFYKSLLVYAG